MQLIRVASLSDISWLSYLHSPAGNDAVGFAVFDQMFLGSASIDFTMYDFSDSWEHICDHVGTVLPKVSSVCEEAAAAVEVTGTAGAPFPLRQTTFNVAFQVMDLCLPPSHPTHEHFAGKPGTFDLYLFSHVIHESGAIRHHAKNHAAGAQVPSTHACKLFLLVRKDAQLTALSPPTCITQRHHHVTTGGRDAVLNLQGVQSGSNVHVSGMLYASP